MRTRTGLFGGWLLLLVGTGLLLDDVLRSWLTEVAWWPVIILGGSIVMLSVAIRQRDGLGMVAACLTGGMGIYWLIKNYQPGGETFLWPIVWVSVGWGMLLRYFRQGIS